jgi:type IV pilus assembly protein PilM
MAKSVGIDIGSKSLKILELEAIGEHVKITHFFNLDIPFGGNKVAEADLLAEPIKHIFHEHHLERNNVAISLPTQDCILREILVDFSHDEHIKKIIKYEAEKYLHSCTVEDVVIEYCKLQIIGESKAKVFLAAVPKEIISRRLELLKACDLDPLVVDLDIMAITNLVRLTSPSADKGTIAIVDVGAVSTKLAIICHGELRHVRAIRVGSNIQDQATAPAKPDVPTEEISDEVHAIDWDIESELIISLPAPEGMEGDRIVLVKKEEAAVTQKKPEQIFERLLREFKRTMLNIDVEGPIDLIYVTGGGSQLPGLSEKFQEALQVKTVPLDIPEKIQRSHDLTEDITVHAPVALGLALGLLDKKYKGMNFRKEDFSYTNRFELIKEPLSVCLTVLMLLIFLLTYQLQTLRLQKEKSYDELLGRVETVHTRIFGEGAEGSKFNKIYNLWDKLKNEEENRQGGGVPPLEDGLLRWQEIARAFATVRNRYYITITRFNLEPREAIIEGEADSDEALDLLKHVICKIKQVDPDDAKTRVSINESNPSPKDAPLKRRYRFQLGYRGGD